MVEYIKFRTAVGTELVRKNTDQVFGVTGCGYESRSAKFYSVGDYLLTGCSAMAAAPSSMTLERIVAMEIIAGAPAAASEGNELATEPEPTHA